VKREPYNPVSLNAKTGYLHVLECTTCWALIGIERTDEHANWHARQSKDEGTQDNGRGEQGGSEQGGTQDSNVGGGRRAGTVKRS